MLPRLGYKVAFCLIQLNKYGGKTGYCFNKFTSSKIENRRNRSLSTALCPDAALRIRRLTPTSVHATGAPDDLCGMGALMQAAFGSIAAQDSARRQKQPDHDLGRFGVPREAFP